MEAITKFWLRAAILFAFALLLSPFVHAQSIDQLVADGKRKEMERRAADDERRMESWELRMAEVRRPPERRRDATLAYSQIRDDYKQIQIVNNDLAKQVASGAELDFKYVTKSVSEIKTRASRLKENMVLPEPPKPFEHSKKEIAAEPKQLKSSLSALDRLILDFVENPIFLQPKTVNIEQAAKARTTLEEIIDLSEQIKKSSEKLKGIAQQKPQ